MSLASGILKRLYIAKSLGVPWSDITITRIGDPVHGKPSYQPSKSTPPPLDFNVTHQAGLVALLGAPAPLDVGVDVVCVNERDDWRTIDQKGWEGWVDVYEDFFSDEELWDMKYTLPEGVYLLDGTHVSAERLDRHDRVVQRDRTLKVTLENGQTREFNSDCIIEAKLRRFYTFWCYKEAYIKLTGEAMMAPWLRNVEFRNVKAPRPGTVPRCSTHGVWGERVTDVEVWLHGKQVEGVRMEIQALEEQYMVAVAVKGESNSEEIKWESLNLERDVMEFIRKQ